MLEQWNNGILGSGKLREWFIGKTLLTRKSINEKLPYKIIIPTFQYSIIPGVRQYATASKNPFNFNML